MATISNLDLIKVLKGQKSFKDTIETISYGTILMEEDIEVLQAYENSINKFKSMIRNEYYSCKVDINAFLDRSDDGDTRGIEYTINGIPRNAICPFYIDDAEEKLRKVTISTLDIIEISLTGFDFKLCNYDDIPRLYNNLKDFIKDYNNMLNTSYNSIVIADDIISECDSLIDILETKYLSVLKYEVEEARRKELERRRRSTSLYDRLGIFNEELDANVRYGDNSNREVFKEDHVSGKDIDEIIKSISFLE